MFIVVFLVLIQIFSLNAFDSLEFFIGAEKVQVDPWGDDSVRVRISPTGTVVDPAVQALLPKPPNQDTNVVLSQNSLSNGNLRVDIAADGKLSFVRISDGTVLLREASHSFMGNEDKLFSAQLSFSANPNENIYGLGEHRTGRVQYKPFFLDFQKSQVYPYSHGGDVSIPLYLSNLGYGFLWNLPSFGYVGFDSSSIEWVSNSTQQLDFWVTTTSATKPLPSPYADLLSHYVDVTGHPPVLPEFASGFWQCKDRYRNQTQLLDVAQGYYSRSLPVDIIVIDWQHWPVIGDWSFNLHCWPDAAALVNNLLDHGTHTMVSVWPLVDGASKNYNNMNTSGYLVHDNTGKQPGFHGGQYLYDPFNAEARDYVWKQVKAGYYDQGIKLYWLDADEPERSTPDQSGQYYYKLGRDLQVGMAYPLQHVQTFYDGLKGLGEPDVLLLSRSAWAGIQRLGTTVWSGDISSTFQELSLQVRSAQNMALSGIYWWTTDIGGYAGGNIQDPVFQELIVRWFQFGAFCPIFRLHGHRIPEDPPSDCGGSGGNNEVWQFGDTAYNVISKVILLREQLRGYLMNQMKLAASIGTPVLRPIFFDFPKDPIAYTVDDQFMFGPDWLVAPVLEYQAKSRTVYLPVLPPNQVWTHYYSNQDYPPGKVSISTPIDSFPLFYRRRIPRVPFVPAVQLFSAERNDSVLCISQQCFAANCPTCSGNYKTVRTEGYTIDQTGVANTIPLELWYSSKFEDNFISNGNPPDGSYTEAFQNGYAFNQPDTDTYPLDLYFNKVTNHHITVASPAGHQWATENGFQLLVHLGYLYSSPH